jgi:ribosomal protein S18 acetylase RimI-like enzyme
MELFVCESGSVVECLPDIIRFEVGIFREDPGSRHTIGDQVYKMHAQAQPDRCPSSIGGKLDSLLMAALPELLPSSLTDLRNLPASALSRLLEEEASAWRNEFFWDFRPSADLVRKFVDLRALTGFALLRNGEVAGYSYYVCEEEKGLIGDLFVRPNLGIPQDEDTLLDAVLDALWKTPGVKRIEGQLMMLRQPFYRRLPHPESLRAFPRRFYQADLHRVEGLGRELKTRQIIRPWLESYREETGVLIARSYIRHIDSEINDQYRSADGANRFLINIIQYPGCGTFFAPASFAAIDPVAKRMTAVCLASIVSDGTGHVTQLCVAPEQRSAGLGHELLRKALVAFAAHRVQRVSLTVTTANQSAIRLYERMGFRNRRDFAAYVWDRR